MALSNRTAESQRVQIHSLPSKTNPMDSIEKSYEIIFVTVTLILHPSVKTLWGPFFEVIFQWSICSNELYREIVFHYSNFYDFAYLTSKNSDVLEY